MSPALEQSLVQKYPSLVSSKTEFAHDDGWFKILEELLAKLNLIGVVSRAVIKLDYAKEKFATLRTFVTLICPADMGEEEARLWREIVMDCETTALRHSSVTCEVSGEYGVLCNKGYWLKTLSIEKAAELGFKAKE